MSTEVCQKGFCTPVVPAHFLNVSPVRAEAKRGNLGLARQPYGRVRLSRDVVPVYVESACGKIAQLPKRLPPL